jgi:hypothetical protein
MGSRRATFGKWLVPVLLESLWCLLRYTCQLSLGFYILLTCHCRRLARRGGVKRIAATIYDDIRQALKDRVTAVGTSSVREECSLT